MSSEREVLRKRLDEAAATFGIVRALRGAHSFTTSRELTELARADVERVFGTTPPLPGIEKAFAFVQSISVSSPFQKDLVAQMVDAMIDACAAASSRLDDIEKQQAALGSVLHAGRMAFTYSNCDRDGHKRHGDGVKGGGPFVIEVKVLTVGRKIIIDLISSTPKLPPVDLTLPSSRWIANWIVDHVFMPSFNDSGSYSSDRDGFRFELVAAPFSRHFVMRNITDGADNSSMWDHVLTVREEVRQWLEDYVLFMESAHLPYDLNAASAKAANRAPK